MSLNREAIYAALFARLQTLPGFVTVSRIWRDWDNVSPAEQPALFLVQGNEQPVNERGLPPKWRLLPTIYIYARHDGDPAAVPGTTLNGLLQAVEGALERQANEVEPFGEVDEWGTSLGGLVSHCTIAGTVVTDEGLMGDQAVAVVPIEILATS